MDLEKVKAQLLSQLLDVATAKKVTCRMEKMEELHKRINAIERYQAYVEVK